MCDLERGQSETLGFLLIFGVVILSVTLVGVAGFAGLDRAQDFQRTTNVEQAFVVLGDNIEDVVQAGAPSRSTEVMIADATLSHESTKTTVTITNENGSSRTEGVDSHPIVYDSDTGTTICYRNGAIIRRDGENAVMVQTPGFVLTNEEVILPLLSTRPLSDNTVGGSTSVNVRIRHAGTSVLALNEPVTNVTVNVSSSCADAWERYFRQFEDDGPVTDVERNGNEVGVSIQTDRVTVTVHRIDVSF